MRTSGDDARGLRPDRAAGQGGQRQGQDGRDRAARSAAHTSNDEALGKIWQGSGGPTCPWQKSQRYIGLLPLERCGHMRQPQCMNSFFLLGSLLASTVAARNRAPVTPIVVAPVMGQAASAASITGQPFLSPALAAPVLPALRWASERAYLGFHRLPEIGRGEFGVVYEHPDDPAAVVKLVADNKDSAYNALLAGSRSREAIERDAVSEAVASQWLAEAGVGPQLLAVVRVKHRLSDILSKLPFASRIFDTDLSRPALIKEKVFGETIEDIKRHGAFGPDEEKLVVELEERLKQAGVSWADIRPSNIMIGATASHPVVQAWLVDAGFLEIAQTP